MATRRQVSIFINGREVENTLKGIYAEKRKITAELNRMEIGSEAYVKKTEELRKVNDILDDHRAAIRQTESAWDNITKGARGFVAVAAAGITADAIIDYGKELFNLGAEMELLGAKAETVFGQALPQVTLAAKENATAMGLTASQYVDAATAIGDLLIPMGFQREEAANLSTSLVNLSGALSEWTGGQVQAEEVSKILSKALLGEREELKQLGISISEADVQARLAEKGLKGLTGQMLEQAKAAATLELITEKSADAQTAYAQNSETLVRRQAEVQAKLQQVSETLATALFPVFERLVGIAATFADGIGNLAQAFGNLADPVGAATSAFSEQSAAAKNLEENILPLADRYDELTAKASRNEEEEKELEAIIRQIGETLPGTIQQVDEYGRILAINTGAVRENVALQGELAEQYRQSAATVIEERIAKLKGENQELRDQVNNWQEIVRARALVGVTVKEEERLDLLQQINSNLQEAGRLEQQLNQLRNPGEAPPAGQDNEENRNAQSPTKEEIRRQAARAEELRKQREKQAEQEAKRREAEAKREEEQARRNLERLQEAAEQFRAEQQIAELEEDEQQIARIRERYRKQIEEAKALEAQKNAEVAEAATAQRVELERLQEEEIARFRQEAELKRQEQRQQFAEQLQAELADEFEQRLLQLQQQYTVLLEQAELYEIDVTAIREKYEEERARIEQERQEEITKAAEAQAKKRIEAANKEAEALRKAALGTAEAIQGALNLANAAGLENTGLSKLLAVAQIAIKSAVAIAEGTAAAAGIPFPGNLAAIGSTIAAVTANIVTAKQILNTAKVPQKKRGGYVDVIGQDDGRRYTAKYIGQPITGMLPGSPVLVDTAGGPVLASEAGQEYFVSNKALRNPVVFNYVRAIDNIARARQFQQGGFSEAPPSPIGAPTPALPPAEQAASAQMMDVLVRLANLLEAGIYARIDDDTLIDIRNRLNQLINASGGAL